jgi:hypothetical protein
MITPQDLIDHNGQFVAITDFTGEAHEGVLHYNPNSQFPIELWVNDCCFITFLAIDDAETLTTMPCILQPNCCSQCLPAAMLMDISETNQFCSCLVNEACILDWNNTRQRYEFDYPGICDCTTFHAELMCSGGQWIVYLALKNTMDFTCMDGINLNFPIDCATMTGTSLIDFTQTGTCACGPCANNTFRVTFSPLPS